MLYRSLFDWRLMMLRAFAALAFGVLTLLWPGLTLWVLVVMFGAYVLVDGISELVDVARGAPATRTHRGWHILDGIVAIAAGLVTFVWPAITALALLFVIAAWAIVSGAIRLWIAISYREVVPHAWLVGLAGALSIVFGVVLAITPGPGALVITWLIGWYAIVFAAILFAYAWRLRGLGREYRQPSSRSARPATV